MPSSTSSSMTALRPQQVCFVVEDVGTAVEFCETQLGWGPFYQFKAEVPDASFKQWTGLKVTEVALGMAGKVQMEFLHVHQGHDTTADYQAQYGTGFQHLGISCESRDQALEYLQSLGATVNELNEYPGVRFAFANVPTGEGMFEILQTTAEMASNSGMTNSRKSSDAQSTLFDLDRATIVTDNMEATLRFYASAFAWKGAKATESTLRYQNKDTRLLRHIARAGDMELEIIQPVTRGDDPYSAHLIRGTHGLIHTGGVVDSSMPTGETFSGEWLETAESFALYDWLGAKHGVQVRSVQ